MHDPPFTSQYTVTTSAFMDSSMVTCNPVLCSAHRLPSAEHSLQMTPVRSADACSAFCCASTRDLDLSILPPEHSVVCFGLSVFEFDRPAYYQQRHQRHGCWSCLKNVKVCSHNSGSKSGSNSSATHARCADSITAQTVCRRVLQTVRKSSSLLKKKQLARGCAGRLVCVC